MASSSRSVSLSVELEAALVRALKQEWKQLNWSHFRERLAEPAFEVCDMGDLGRWVLRVRTMQLSRALVLDHPWGVVVEVLKHEMAHQFVHEALGVLDETAHGPAFKDVCGQLGIDAAATGVPAAPPTDDEKRVLERIAKLLALAESPNEHEAQAAMAAAQKLLLTHNLEDRARLHARGYAFRHVGAAATRHAEHEKLLGTILGRYFFVEAIWVPVYLPQVGKRVTVLELVGTPANLEIAEYVHGYLLTTAERLWREHKRSRFLESDRDRRTYLAGVLSGFSRKLAREAQQHREQGLVWVKDGDLEAFYARRHPKVRSFKYGGGPKREAFAHGQSAGESIVLHHGVGAGPATGGRLLPPKR
jgi:hypothetical protein